MKILAMEYERSAATGDRFQPHLKAEARQVWELYQAGVIREIYFRGDRSAAVLVLESTGLDEARRELDRLPLVREGLIAFELIPLVPYPGFARLFGSEK